MIDLSEFHVDLIRGNYLFEIFQADPDQHNFDLRLAHLPFVDAAVVFERQLFPVRRQRYRQGFLLFKNIVGFLRLGLVEHEVIEVLDHSGGDGHSKKTASFGCGFDREIFLRSDLKDQLALFGVNEAVGHFLGE